MGNIVFWHMLTEKKLETLMVTVLKTVDVYS